MLFFSIKGRLSSGVAVFELVAETAQFLFAVAPVAFHLNKEFEEYFFAEKRFDVFACFGSHFAQCGASFADEYGFLRFAFAVDDGADAYEFFLFFEYFDGDFGRVGNLFVVVEQNFFAYDFVHEETLRTYTPGPEI